MSSVMYRERAVLMEQLFASQLFILRCEVEVGFLPHRLDAPTVLSAGTAASRAVAAEVGKPRGPRE